MPNIDDTLAAELYTCLVKFVDSNSAIPSEHAFYQWLIRSGVYDPKDLSLGTFRYHFERLIIEHWIEIEPETRALRPLRQITIVVEKDNPQD